MVNFTLQYRLLEDKSKTPHECEWCGVNFGGWKRKYCTPKCREEEKAYERNKAKIARAKKRQEKRLLREKEEQDKRIAKLNKELERLREENRKLHCVVCDKELTGKQTLYCSDECSLEPYTIESDYYIEKCIIEELPLARYTDGSFHSSTLYKGLEFYYGPNYCERSLIKYRKKSAVKSFITLLKQRIKQLEDGERKESMVIDAD